MRILTISCEYLARELRDSNRDVRGWIAAYCSRNNIFCAESRYGVPNNEPYLRLEFRSFHQLDCFVRRGNQEYPYFEFR